MKKILALGLCLALILSLGVTALAAEIPEGWTPADGARGVIPEGWTPADGARDVIPEGWTPADGARDLPEVVDVPIPASYFATVTVDGVEVNTAGIPGAPAGYVPMRVVCETAGGLVDWYPEDNEALFFLDEISIVVSFTDLSVSVAFETLEGVTAYLDPAGYTFLPVSVLAGLETVSVDYNLELDVERYDIVTSASDPTVKLVKSIMEAVDSGARVKYSPAEMDEYLGIHQENFADVAGYFPMMINADTIVVGQVAEGKLDAAKEDLEAQKQSTIQSFENYLPDPYEMALKGQVVVAPDGQHVMLIISGDNDKAIELFNAAYPAQ